MKLVYAIVNNDDTYAVNSGLRKKGIRATKFATTGGFLQSGNTTFLICCKDEQVDIVIEVCKDFSKKRKQYVLHLLLWKQVVLCLILWKLQLVVQLFLLQTLIVLNRSNTIHN